jgi:uncharacterized membrane protein
MTMVSEGMSIPKWAKALPAKIDKKRPVTKQILVLFILFSSLIFFENKKATKRLQGHFLPQAAFVAFSFLLISIESQASCLKTISIFSLILSLGQPFFLPLK